MINISNEDNMNLMARYPDNHFELAIVDPPYGIGANKEKEHNGWKSYGVKQWDNSIPSKKYFNELFRVSKNQIIWGGNYMTDFLKPSMCWILWDKGQRDFSLADGELAWSSFDKALRIFTMPRITALSDAKNSGGKIHATQKPVKLYEWLLMNYAKEGDKILDTHLGSGSIALACHNLKYDLTACELDKDYYDAAMLRLKQHQQQLTMF
jgi:site-specific DNA-methyltransferase (adenine-specific)